MTFERVPIPVLGLVMIPFILGACASPPSSRSSFDPSSLNYEGLETVNARNFEFAQIRPGISFNGYSGLIVNEPELAFRTPDRSQQQFPLSEDQKQRFKDVLGQAFNTEFASLSRLALADQPDDGVLVLSVRVQDITATVPSRSLGNVGRAAFTLQAIGDVTLMVEVRDSRSEEILARGVDMRAVEGVALAQDGGVVTRWQDVERLCAHWARIARTGVETLVETR